MRKILNEQLDITDAHPLKARFYDYKNFTYPWHFHSEFEVIYIEKGYGLGMAGDGMTDFSDQQLFLLGSNLPHYLENAPEYDLKEELRVNGVIIQFEKDFMQYAFSHYSQFQGINRLLEEAQRGLLFSLSNCTNDIPQIIKRIPQKEGVGQIVELLQLLDALTHLTPEKVIPKIKLQPNRKGGVGRCPSCRIISIHYITRIKRYMEIICTRRSFDRKINRWCIIFSFRYFIYTNIRCIPVI